MRFRRENPTHAAMLPAGAWMPWQASFTNGLTIHAVLCCPQGHLGSISNEVHTIAPDGRVSPSYVCPHQGCTFHAFISLDGWA